MKNKSKSQMNDFVEQRFFFVALMSLASLGFSNAKPGMANELPSDYKVISGEVEITEKGNDLYVNSASERAIVNYGSFNVGSDSSVNFNLPNAQSAILNRVIGNNASEIHGKINSNGNVFLINQNGILFGKSASVNVNSFLASTLSIADSEFLEGKMRFSQEIKDPKGILNQGELTSLNGGSITLLAGAIQNDGTITAPNGSVNLAVGESIALELDKDIVANVKIDKPVQQAVADLKAAINNLGQINSASRVRLEASLASKLYDLTVNNEGMIAANSISSSGGVIELIAVSGSGDAIVRSSGTLSAQSEDSIGGQINVLGDLVLLDGDSLINASGARGGGTILIGGDKGGKNPEIINSQKTFVGLNANILADAWVEGDGGTVIVWADDTTAFFGKLSAQGGSERGNGGFAEISGYKELFAAGQVNLSAANGSTGDLLYDPLNIEIKGGTGDGSDNGNIISAELKNSPGSNVFGSILFADEGAGTPNPFIVFESEIEGTNANIILQARNGITTSGTFGGSEVLLQNNRNLTLQTNNAALDGAAGIDLTGSTHGAALNFRTQGTGTITLRTGTAGVSTAGITAGGLQTANRAISLQTNGGLISLNGLSNSGTGSLSLTSAGGSISQAAGITAGILSANSGAGNATLTNATNNIVTLNATSTSGNISYREADGQNFNLGASNLTTGGDLSLQVGGTGAITQTGALIADVLNVTGGTGGTNAFNFAGNNINTLTANTSGANVSYAEIINQGFALGFSNLGTGNLTLGLSGTGSLTQSAAAVGNSLTVNTITGNAALNLFNNDFVTFAGTSSSTGTIAFRDDNGFALGSNNRGTATLSLQSGGGDITQSASLAANTLNITTTTGNAIITNAANNISNLTANTTGGNVSYQEVSGGLFNLGASALGTGDLNLQVGGTGTITQTGALIADILNVTAGTSGTNAFNFAGNNINTLVANTSGANVSYTESLNQGFSVGASALGTGNLTLTSSGTSAISQSGAITSGILTINLGAGSAVLNNAGNAQTTLVASTAGGDIQYTEKANDNLILGAMSLGAGDLTVNLSGSGSLNQSGAFALDVANINLGSSGSSILANASNNINILNAQSTGASLAYSEAANQSFTLNNANFTAGGDLSVAVSGTGILSLPNPIVADVFTVGTGANALTVANATINTFQANSTAGNVTFNAALNQSFNLGTSSLTGGGDLTLNLSGSGVATQTSSLGADVFTINAASSGNNVFTNAGNNINTLVASSSGANVSYLEGVLNAGFSVGGATLAGGGDLTLAVNPLGTGAISQTVAISADVLTVNVGAGSANLSNTGNNVNSLTANATSGAITYRDADSVSVNAASSLGTGSLSVTGGNSVGADVTVLGPLSGGNLTFVTQNNGNIITGTNSLSATNLALTTSAGHATQDGTVGGAAIETNTGTLTANSTSGTIKISEKNALDVLNSSLNAGSLIVTNNASDINLLGTGISVTTGTLDFTAANDLLIFNNSANQSVVAGATGTMNLKAGRDIVIGSNSANSNIDVRGGNQTLNAGRDLTVIGRSVGGVGGFTRLTTSSVQNIITGNDLNVKVGTGTTGINNFAEISATGTASSQVIDVGNSINVDPGTTVNGSIARITAADDQSIKAVGNIVVQGNSANNSLGQIINSSNASAPVIFETTGAGSQIVFGFNGQSTVRSPNFTVNTNGGQAYFTNADFNKIQGDFKGGYLTLNDSDGVTLGNLDASGNLLEINTFATLAVPTTNSVNETSTIFSGDILAKLVRLRVLGGNASQPSGSIVTPYLEAEIFDGDVLLNSPLNDVDQIVHVVLDKPGASFQFTDADDLEVQTLKGIDNLIAGDTLAFKAGDHLTGIGAVTTGGGNLTFVADNNNDGIGTFDLVGDLDAVGGTITLQSAGLDVDNMLITTGTINLTSTDVGNIRQSVDLYADTLNVAIGSGTADLLSSTNNVVNFSAKSSSGGIVNYYDLDDINITASNLGTTGNLALFAGAGSGTGGITQTGPVIANALNANANNASISLGFGANNVNELSGFVVGGDFYFREDNGGFATGDITAKGGNVHLRSSNAPGITQLSGTSLMGNTLIVELFGLSDAVLTNTGNDFQSVDFASQASNLSYFDQSGFDILRADMDSNSVGAVGNLTLEAAADSITQNSAYDGIQSNNLSIKLKAGGSTLNFADNDVNKLTVDVDAGSLEYSDSDGVLLGPVNGSAGGSIKITTEVSGVAVDNNRNVESGIVVSDSSAAPDLNLTLVTSGSTDTITQALGAVLKLDSLTTQSVNGNIMLTENTNDVNNFSANTQNASAEYVDANSVNLESSSVGFGDLTVSVSGDGDITQSGPVSGSFLRAVIDGAGSVVLNNSDFTYVSLNAANGNIQYSDSDAFNLVGSSASPNGLFAVNTSVAGLTANNLNLEANLGLDGYISGATVSLVAGGLDQISQISGTIQGQELVLASNGEDISILDSDFNKFSATTFGGNLQIKDVDGLNLDYVDLGFGRLDMETSVSGLSSDNLTAEIGSGILDTLKVSDALLNISSGDFGLNASEIKAINSLILNVLDGNITANSLDSFPEITTPDLQITASGAIAGPTSPIGLNIAALGPTSFINASGGIGLYDFAALSGLRLDSTNEFYLYPLALIPVIDPSSLAGPVFVGSTNPFILSSTVYEDENNTRPVSCSLNESGLQVCRKVEKEEDKQDLDFQNVYFFGNKISR